MTPRKHVYVWWDISVADAVFFYRAKINPYYEAREVDDART